jgi:serine phosphatase RsbU (regulator of sigma subunit)
MPVFQVSSRTVRLPGPPKKRARRFPSQWYVVARVVVSGFIGGTFFTLLIILFGPNTVFILLPVLVSLTWAQPQLYNINKFLASTPVYLLLTICLTFIYYGAITVVQLLLYMSQPIIIPVTSALAFAIILDPVRVYIQQRIERRFNFRERDKAIEAFTTTLREEIDLDQLRERFLTVIQQTMQPYSITLWTRVSNSQRQQSSSPEEIRAADDDPLIAYMLSHSSVLEIDRLHLDSPVLQDLKLRAEDIIQPLASQGELIGVLILGPHLKGEPYTNEERSMLTTLAPQVAPALRVAQMVQERQVQVRERERIEQELQTAQSIQRAFLPKDLPALLGWQLVTYYQPARQVGGDFYDFLSFEDGRLGLVIGDVSGKGVPAALVMATVHTMLRSTVQGMASSSEILGRVNDLLAAEIPAGMFVTCFFALLDPKSGLLRYANAGQDVPYRFHRHTVSELWATGMPLGMMPGSSYEGREVTLAPGESLLFYSDGLVEAHNPRGEMFGFPRLQRMLEEHADGRPLIDVLRGELKSFTGEGWEQEDDVTLLTLQRMSEPI